MCEKRSKASHVLKSVRERNLVKKKKTSFTECQDVWVDIINTYRTTELYIYWHLMIYIKPRADCTMSIQASGALYRRATYLDILSGKVKHLPREAAGGVHWADRHLVSLDDVVLHTHPEIILHTHKHTQKFKFNLKNMKQKLESNGNSHVRWTPNEHILM